MNIPKIVIDTNIIVSALQSNKGAAYKLLMLIGKNKFELNISVPLVLEYEYSTKKMKHKSLLTDTDIDDIIDYICNVGIKREIFYLWRPYLKDPKDDMVLELAFVARCDAIVTYNGKDFRGVEKDFGIKILTAQEFLQEIGEL